FKTLISSADEGQGTAIVLVTLSKPADHSVSVDYAVTGGTATGGGVDYTLAAGTLTFAVGETSKAIPIALTDDLLNENGETVVITLSNEVGAPLGAHSH